MGPRGVGNPPYSSLPPPRPPDPSQFKLELQAHKEEVAARFRKLGQSLTAFAAEQEKFQRELREELRQLRLSYGEPSLPQPHSNTPTMTVSAPPPSSSEGTPSPPLLKLVKPSSIPMTIEPNLHSPTTLGTQAITNKGCVGVWQHDCVETSAKDQGNKTTSSYVAFTDTECLIGDVATNQVTMNPINTVSDVKRSIGRKFSDPSVQGDMNLWPFMVVAGPCDKPMVNVTYKGEEKKIAAEEILSMVLINMREIQVILEDLKSGKGHELEHCFSGVDKRVRDKGGGHTFQLGNNPKVITTMPHDPQYWKSLLNDFIWGVVKHRSEPNVHTENALWNVNYKVLLNGNGWLLYLQLVTTIELMNLKIDKAFEEKGMSMGLVLVQFDKMGSDFFWGFLLRGFKWADYNPTGDMNSMDLLLEVYPYLPHIYQNWRAILIWFLAAMIQCSIDPYVFNDNILLGGIGGRVSLHFVRMEVKLDKAFWISSVVSYDGPGHQFKLMIVEQINTISYKMVEASKSDNWAEHIGIDGLNFTVLVLISGTLIGGICVELNVELFGNYLESHGQYFREPFSSLQLGMSTVNLNLMQAQFCSSNKGGFIYDLRHENGTESTSTNAPKLSVSQATNGSDKIEALILDQETNFQLRVSYLEKVTALLKNNCGLSFARYLSILITSMVSVGTETTVHTFLDDGNLQIHQLGPHRVNTVKACTATFSDINSRTISTCSLVISNGAFEVISTSRDSLGEEDSNHAWLYFILKLGLVLGLIVYTSRMQPEHEHVIGSNINQFYNPNYGVKWVRVVYICNQPSSSSIEIIGFLITILELSHWRYNNITWFLLLNLCTWLRQYLQIIIHNETTSTALLRFLLVNSDSLPEQHHNCLKVACDLEGMMLFEEDGPMPNTQIVHEVDCKLQDRNSFLALLKQNLHKAQERMKLFHDKQHTQRTFEVDDLVYLKWQSYKQPSVEKRTVHKLLAKYHGLSEEIAYKLKLSASARTHPAKVIDTMLVKRKGQASTRWLIQWIGALVEDVNGEFAEDIMARYPDLNLEEEVLQLKLEDKLFFKAGRVVRDQNYWTNTD